MTPVGWMVAGALGTAAIAVAAAPEEAGLEIVLGMAAPLAAVVGTWMAVTRAARRDPARVTGVMLKGFGIKVVFFCGYVVAALAGLGLDARPFVVSFTAYFIALYSVEALLLSRLFIGHLRQAR